MKYKIGLIGLIGWCTMFLWSCHPIDNPKPENKIDTDAELVEACSKVQGGGVGVTGGDGGTIYRVTRLDDAKNPDTGLPMVGTLRYAINQVGARRILFSVSGTIYLEKEPLRIKTGNITIDGQSAPGDGICIANQPLIVDGASNVIIRFIRIRLGDKSNTESDALSVNDATGVLLDHLSCSWSVDECVSCYGNTNFTMQYCIISESLRESVHGKGKHGYGGIWGGTNASFHHNLLAHHDSRNPRFDHDYVNAQCAGPIDYVNNVVYNWGNNSAYGGEGSTNGAGGRQINFVNNYYKYGPATPINKRIRFVDPTTNCSNCTDKLGGIVVPPQIYLAGNYMYGSEAITADNWQGSTVKTDAVKVLNRWTEGLTTMPNEQSAEAAYETVLAKAGCSLRRDVVDTRIVEEVRKGTYTYKGCRESNNGLIDSQADVGGWPELKSETKPMDTDFDGIPDDWEINYNLDPLNPADARDKTLVSNHTNLDVYMCYLVRDLY